jgi:hypothetical protein
VRPFYSATSIPIALLVLACAPPAATSSAGATGGGSAPPRERELEVSVRMGDELAEEAVVPGGGLVDGDRTGQGDRMQAAPPIGDDKRAEDEAASPPPPPPPPPPRDDGKASKRKAIERPSPQAATADSAGAKVDSTTIQQVIAKNVGSFKPCLRSDMALRLEATISPSGDVL